MKKFIIFFALLAIAYSQLHNLGSYNEIARAEIDSSVALKNILDFGTQEFIKKASQELQLTSPQFTQTKVESAYRQVVAGMNYKFNVVYTDANGKTWPVTLVVYTVPWENKMELTSYEIKK